MADESLALRSRFWQGTKIENLSGLRFGRLIVVGLSSERTKSNRIKWDVQCDCGNTKSVQAINLKSGDTTSCGCVHKDQLTKRLTTHGQSYSSEYTSWMAMNNRCFNPNGEDFHHYGGRGVTISPVWRDFSSFLRDMGEKPGPGYSIERIDLNGDYEPSNCRWATQSEQVRNTRRNHRVDDKTVLTDAARSAGLNPGTVFSRVGKLGWTMKDALSIPVRHRS